MATRANIVLDQRTTFTTAIDLNDANGNPIDLSSYSILAQVRKSPTSTNAVSFTATGNSSGIILLSMNAATTSTLSAGRYVYDVLVTNVSGQATRVVEGQVTVSPAVSK
jgi:hypothetical protein